MTGKYLKLQNTDVAVGPTSALNDVSFLYFFEYSFWINSPHFWHVIDWAFFYRSSFDALGSTSKSIMFLLFLWIHNMKPDLLDVQRKQTLICLSSFALVYYCHSLSVASTSVLPSGCFVCRDGRSFLDIAYALSKY